MELLIAFIIYAIISVLMIFAMNIRINYLNQLIEGLEKKGEIDSRIIKIQEEMIEILKEENLDN